MGIHQSNYNKSQASLVRAQLKLVVALLMMTLGMFAFQNCSKYSDPSLFDYNKAATTTTAASTAAPLEAPNGVVDVNIYETKISVGGDCNVAADKKHYIEVKLQDQSNLDMQIRFEGALCPQNATNADCFRATQFRCENGHYYIVLPIDCSMYRQSTTSQYRMLGQLVTFDDKGNEVRDDNSKFDRFFSIAWDPSNCTN